MKKALIFVGVFALIVFTFVFIDTTETIRGIKTPEDIVYHDAHVPNGFIEAKRYYQEDGFQDYTDYAEYIYDVSASAKFQRDHSYKITTEENIPELLSYFADFQCYIPGREGYEDWYTFDAESQVDAGDYFIIENDNSNCEDWRKFSSYNIYYFDMQNSTLHYFHNNI